MPGWLPPLDSLVIVRVLFWGTILVSACTLVTDHYLCSILRAHWKPLLIVIVLVLLWRVPSGGRFFQGMEYEDSYAGWISATKCWIATIWGNNWPRSSASSLMLRSTSHRKFFSN